MRCNHMNEMNMTIKKFGQKNIVYELKISKTTSNFVELY